MDPAGSPADRSPAASTPSPREVTFVVPALNEERNIEDTVREIHRAGQNLDDYEILIVDDGSTDRTPTIIRGLAAEDQRVRFIINPKNLGLGGAYKVGVANAFKPFVIMVPGDNNHPADGIVPILDLLGTADVVIPYVANPEVRGFKRRAISAAFRTILNVLFRLQVPYYNGLVLHRTELLRRITIDTNSFAYQAEALVKLLRGGATSVSVPVPISERGDRSTRAFKLKNFLAVGGTICRLALRR